MKRFLLISLLLFTLLCGCAPQPSEDKSRIPKNSSTNSTQTISNAPSSPSSESQSSLAPLPASSASVTTPTPIKKEVDLAKISTVYVTDSGKKYHRAGCQYLKKSSSAISLNSAKNQYAPCSKCNPPT